MPQRNTNDALFHRWAESLYHFVPANLNGAPHAMSVLLHLLELCFSCCLPDFVSGFVAWMLLSTCILVFSGLVMPLVVPPIREALSPSEPKTPPTPRQVWQVAAQFCGAVPLLLVACRTILLARIMLLLVLSPFVRVTMQMIESLQKWSKEKPARPSLRQCSQWRGQCTAARRCVQNSFGDVYLISWQFTYRPLSSVASRLLWMHENAAPLLATDLQDQVPVVHSENLKTGFFCGYLSLAKSGQQFLHRKHCANL